MTDPTAPVPPDRPTDSLQPASHFPVVPPAGSTPTPDPSPSPGDTLPEVASPPKRSTAQPWILGGAALVIALTAGIAIGGLAAGDGDQAASVSSSTSATPSSPAATTIAPTTAAPTTAAPTTAAPTSAAPSPTKAAPRPKPSYAALTERQWKLVAKNPDAYIGKTYVVFGRVTQFDAATGVDTFRADVAHKRMADEYDYETNTMLSGDSDALENLVEDDIFRANVTVLGSYSYETQIGGETTVPLLMVASIKVL